MTDKEYLQKIGLEIKIARIRNKMTAEQLAERCGLGRDSISNIETGKANSHILTYKKIAEVLEIEVKDIV